MGNDVMHFHEIDRTMVALVGGKGANLGELSRIVGVRVPDGFCVTTDAYRRVVSQAPSIERIVIPDDLAAAIGDALAQLGEHGAYAVRSSATAEDTPSASYAGQHDSYLNVVGHDAILEHVRRCWASVGSSRVDLQACKLEYSIVSPK